MAEMKVSMSTINIEITGSGMLEIAIFRRMGTEILQLTVAISLCFGPGGSNRQETIIIEGCGTSVMCIPTLILLHNSMVSRVTVYVVLCISQSFKAMLIVNVDHKGVLYNQIVGLMQQCIPKTRRVLMMHNFLSLLFDTGGTLLKYHARVSVKEIDWIKYCCNLRGVRKCILVLLKQVTNTFPQLIMTIEKHSYGDKADTGGKKAKVELCAIITRAQFEELWMSMFFKSVGLVGKCLNEAKVDNVQIQEVVLVSKSTRIPIIQHLLKDYFDEKKLYTSINQDDSMACDTTVLDAILIGNGDENVQELLVVDVSLLDLGVETVGRTIIVLISRNATNSAMEEQTFPTYSDHQRENAPIEELSRLNYCNWHWHFYGCSIQPVIQARFNGPSN
ncbi:hypothetical protein FXO37_27876 [Capsicum annuum]|nr:hypothetical protein FXO37_27876 [Capsicum annuum]